MKRTQYWFGGLNSSRTVHLTKQSYSGLVYNTAYSCMFEWLVEVQIYIRLTISDNLIEVEMFYKKNPKNVRYFHVYIWQSGRDIQKKKNPEKNLAAATSAKAISSNNLKVFFRFYFLILC